MMNIEVEYRIRPNGDKIAVLDAAEFHRLREYALAYERMLSRGELPEGRDYPDMPRDSMG